VNGLVEIVQVDGDGVMLVDGVTPIQGDHTNDPVPPSENDYSIGLKIRFGLIDYATAGDSDGEYATSQWGYTYNDVETILAPRFGQVDILRANHHGSGHSTNQFYVDALNPDAAAISCGNNTYGHPGQGVIDRLLGTGDLYLTNMCDATRNYGTAVIVGGDIIILSTDGINYTIDGNAYVASDPSGPTPTPTNTPTETATPTPTETPTPTATAGSTVMHVETIEMSVVAEGGPWYHAEAVVTILDAGGAPVSGATVSGSFTGDSSGPASGGTDANGQVTVISPRARNGVNWTLCVDDVIKSGASYNAGANLETCDSTGQSPTSTPTAAFTATSTPTPTSGGPTATPTDAPTFTPTSAGSGMHVGDLDGSSTSQGGTWTAIVTITVHDAAENPVADATVNGTWSLGASGADSCVTDANGQCTVQQSGIKKKDGSAVFTIDSVTHASLSYLSASNHDPDGDSNGTAITVLKP